MEQQALERTARRGMSLVELLVVIFIISILITMVAIAGAKIWKAVHALGHT
jgi:prepilin-type N-terminal cleavage/methylation domain-containing protein